MQKICLFTLIFLSITVSVAFAQDEPLTTVTTQGSRLNIREIPDFDAPILGQLEDGTAVRLLGRSDAGYGGWVKISAVDGSLTGWTIPFYLEMPLNDIYWRLPVLATDFRTPTEPIIVEGHAIAYTNWETSLHLRTEPNLEATILGSLPSYTLLQV